MNGIALRTAEGAGEYKIEESLIVSTMLTIIEDKLRCCWRLRDLTMHFFDINVPAPCVSSVEVYS